MPLKIIGVGWGRTGTQTLKSALKTLGLGRCYNMFKLVKDPTKIELWEKLFNIGKTDFDILLDGYSSAVYFPIFIFYKELIKHYPDAKVILTVRDSEEYFYSAVNTIFRTEVTLRNLMLYILSTFSKQYSNLIRIRLFIEKELHQRILNGKKSDKIPVIEAFNKWNEDLRKTIPLEKLLVLNIKYGWAPLCAFLKVPIPVFQFPRLNSREGFNKRIRTLNLIGENNNHRKVDN